MVDFARLGLIGRSRPFLEVLNLIEKFAACDHTVLIGGETGAGKELAARALHFLSKRRGFPFVAVNCGALPETLVESELFGHARGAFTDARESKPGIIAQAEGGALFLDEIEAMTMHAQVALLRFLQDKEYRPVGCGSVTSADVRVIAATNADLPGMVRDGRFRADLMFRLQVLQVWLPALRDRAGDVMILAGHTLARLNRESRASPKVLHPASEATLCAHRWPGNVRELENVMLREYLLATDSSILIASAQADVERAESPALPSLTGSAFKTAKARAVAAFEQAYITEMLSKSGGNLSLAARLSGKDRSDLCKLLRKHGILRRQFETH